MATATLGSTAPGLPNPAASAYLPGSPWINFWASSCPPCQAETPILREIDERYRDRGLTLIAVQGQQTVEDGLA